VPKLDWYYKREVYKREVGLGGRLGTAREFIAVGW
jgi:hypothetical protein